MKKFLFFIASLSLLVVGCVSPEGPEVPDVGNLELSQNYIDVNAAGGTFSIDVISDYSSLSSSHYEDWVHTSWSGKTLLITVDQNPFTYSRECIVTVSCDEYNLSTTLTISQHSNNSSPIVGSWHLKSFCGTEAEVDVYMQLNEDSSFLLYQRSTNQGYATYDGIYYIDDKNSSISGIYSDGAEWANSYYYSISTDGNLVFTNTNNSAEVSIYEPSQMPTISRATAAHSTSRPL